MKILLTFEFAPVILHFIDVVRLLNYWGHKVYFYNAGKRSLDSRYAIEFGDNISILNELGDTNQYDMWIYDLLSWDYPKSVLIPEMESFKGTMICIEEGDGAQFMEQRTSDIVIDKTSLFMRNVLHKDRTKYNTRIRNKLFISTCHITNSQDFKYIRTPFDWRLKRAIFTGSLTGLSENGDSERYLCRIKVPMTLINAGIPCVYRLHSYNPSWKKKFDECVPNEYKASALDRETFIKEMLKSMIILSLRGNSHVVNRFYEGLASGGLVFSTKFRDAVDFYGHGEAGIHYVEIEWDGSDVVDKAKYYFEHTYEAQTIAENGRKLWEEYSMLDKNKLLPKKVIDYYVNGIKEISGIDILKI